MPSDLDAVQEHRAVDLCVRMDVHAGRQHRAPHAASRHDHAGADDRADGVAGATLLLDDELRGRQRLGPAVDRPVQVVEVEGRASSRRGPCARRSRRRASRRRASSRARARLRRAPRCARSRRRVPRPISTSIGMMSPPRSWLEPSSCGVGADRVDQRLRREHVVAHRREDLVGRVREALRRLRLLAEARRS